MIAVLVLCVPVLAQGSHPSAQEQLVLTGDQGEYPLGRHMDILEDPSGKLTIDEVASPDYASRFAPSQEDVPVYSYTTSVFWLRLRLRNEAPLTGQWLLEVNFPNLNYVDLYIPAAGGGYEVKQSGALRPFDTRDIPYYHIVFKLPLGYQDEDTFYIRVQGGSSMTLAFTLWSPETFALNKITDMLGVGLFYGALLIMLGYHLFALYSLKEVNYFYFVLVLASAILFFASYEGVADQFLWPGWSQFKTQLLVITMSLFFISTLKFSDSYLEQESRAPRIHLLFNLMIGVWGLMIVIMPFSSYYVMAKLVSPLILLTPAFAVLAGIYNWRKGYYPAKFYLISWLGFMLELIVTELVRADILPSTTFTEKSYQIGLIWLLLMWSLALADRINLLKKETEGVNLKLLQSEQKLSQTLDGLPIGVVVYGPERIPTYTNQRAINILTNPVKGIRAAVSARRTLAEAAKYFSFRITGSDQDYPLERHPVQKAFEGKSASVDDVEVDLIDRRVPLEIWASPVRDEQGNIESVVAAFLDITQRKQSEAELAKYQQQLEHLVDQRTAELSVTNQQLYAENAERQRLENVLRLRLEWLVVVNQVNQAITNTSDLVPAYQKFTGMIPNWFSATGAFVAELDTQNKELKLLSHSCQGCVDSDLAGSVFPLQSAALAHQTLELGKPIMFPRDQLSQLDGPVGAHFQSAESQSLAVVPLYFDQNITGLLGLEFLEAEKHFSADEISLIERICIDIAQVREKAWLSEQTRAVITAEERNSLARELHDSVTQVLFAASLVAEVLPQIWRNDPEKAQVSLEELRRLTHGALAEMRTMLLELRPSAAIKTPLSELLAQLTESITSRTGLPFQLFIEHIPPLPEDVHIGFYRIAQESMNNIVKHALASQASVSLSATLLRSDPTEAWSGELKMVVRDNGRGFVPSEGGSQHLGLAIMRERAEAIHADLSVESRPGAGTTVTLTWQG